MAKFVNRVDVDVLVTGDRDLTPDTRWHTLSHHHTLKDARRAANKVLGEGKLRVRMTFVGCGARQLKHIPLKKINADLVDTLLATLATANHPEAFFEEGILHAVSSWTKRGRDGTLYRSETWDEIEPSTVAVDRWLISVC